MANLGVRLRIDHSKMRAVVGTISKESVQKAAETTRTRYEQNIRAAGLVNSGKLAASVVTAEVPARPPLHPAMAIGSPLPYVKYPEYGTRAHGPVRAKALRFRPKGSATYVFAKWVRGVRPYRFAQNALDALRPTDFE